MKQYLTLRTAIVLIILVLLAPLAVTVLTSVMTSPISNFETSNDWIGFFGSYIGAILGGIITLIVMKCTNNSNRDIENENRKNEFCHNLSDLISDYCVYASDCYYTYKYDTCGYKQSKMKLSSITYNIEIRLSDNELAEKLVQLTKKLNINVQLDKYCKGEDNNIFENDLKDVIEESKIFINKYLKELY